MFFEHFVYIVEAMNEMGGGDRGLSGAGQFFYDWCRLSGAPHVPLKIRSLVGIVPLFAVWILDFKELQRLPGFAKRMQWFLDHRPSVKEHIDLSQKAEPGGRFLLAIANRERLERMLRYVFAESEFLSPYGIRSLSKYHRDHPFTLQVGGLDSRVDYEPAESSRICSGGMFRTGARTGFLDPFMNFLLIDRKLSHEKDKPRFRIELAIVPTAHSSVPAAVVKILSLGSLPITINQGRYLSKRLTTQSMYSLQNSMEEKSNSFVVVGCACAGVADFALVAVNGRDVRPAPVVGSRLM